MIDLKLTIDEATALRYALEQQSKIAQQRRDTALESNTKMLYSMTINGLNAIIDKVDKAVEEVKNV